MEIDREKLLEPIVGAVQENASVAGADVRRFFTDWEIIPVRVEDRHVATIVLKGTEIHFALVAGWRPKACYRGAIKAFLKPLIERQGYLTTRVPHDRPAQKQFVARVGFKPTWRDDKVEYFMLAGLPFERKNDAI